MWLNVTVCVTQLYVCTINHFQYISFHAFFQHPFLTPSSDFIILFILHHFHHHPFPAPTPSCQFRKNIKDMLPLKFYSAPIIKKVTYISTQKYAQKHTANLMTIYLFQITVFLLTNLWYHYMIAVQRNIQFNNVLEVNI